MQETHKHLTGTMGKNELTKWFEMNRNNSDPQIWHQEFRQSLEKNPQEEN